MNAGMAEVIAAVLSAGDPRGNDMRRWPKDEIDAYQDAGGLLRGEEAARALQTSKLAAHVAEELTKAGYGMVQAKGYLIVDKVTGALDWDGELHATVKAAIDSLCGPYQPFCRDPEDFTGDDTTYWADVYAIHPVSAPLDPRLIAALADPEGHALVKAIRDRKAVNG